MDWNTQHDRFLSLSSWVAVIMYGVPAVVVLLVLDYFDSTRHYVTPALLVYLVGAIAHLLTWGFQAVCLQIKVSIDYAVEQRASGKE